MVGFMSGFSRKVENSLTRGFLKGIHPTGFVQKISTMECQLFDSPDGHSGNLISFLKAGDRKLVVKYLRPATDWKSIASQDHRFRSVLVWQYGQLDRLYPHIDHAILAGNQDEEGNALLMRDVSHGSLAASDFDRPLTRTLLDSLAAMHAIYWEDDRSVDPALGLATAEILLTFGWPKNAYCYSHDARIVELIANGWDALFDLLEPDVCAALQTIMDQPQHLVVKLSQFPRTFIYADFRLGNITVLPESKQVVAFDWEDVPM
jgi:hypothetical protein